MLDLKTILSSYVISNALCAFVMATLWRQNRRRAPELAFWLADFIMQFLAVLLIVMRGILPDFISIVVGNVLVIVGTVLLYIGLERYVGKPSSYWPNALLLVVFLGIHIYFGFIRPSLQARNLNISTGLLLICGQAAWLMLRRVDAEMRRATRLVGLTFALYSLVSLTRIFVDSAAVPPSNDLFKSGLFDTLVILSYQMLFITLTFALFLMVNRRLFGELEQDILERRRAEAALKRTEKKFQSAFHTIPDAVAISRMDDGRIIEVNESFFQISEYPKEEVMGKTTIELNLWGNLPDRGSFIQELQAHGRVLNFETSFRKKSGLVFPGLISGQPIQLDEGSCVLTIIHDITLRKQAELQIKADQAELTRLLTESERSRKVLLQVFEDRKMAEDEIRTLNAELEQRVSERTKQLETSNKELEAFAYSVSHDLRAPLRAIDGFSRILQKEYTDKLDQEGQRFLSIIRDSASKMDHLITDLLALARVSSTQFNRSPIDMTTLAKSIYFESTSAEVREKFTFTISDLPMTSGDLTLMRQLWANLISNAVKYTLPKEIRTIEISGSEKDGLCTYSIRDSGVGFNPKYAGKIFDLFQRLHKESEFEGTGVGLAIVQRIVQRHGGQVWGEGEIGKGAVFYFTIPQR